MPRQRYQLTLVDHPPRLREGMPEPVPAPVRLRQLVKLALRVFGFRCVEARELDPPGAAGDRLPPPR
jgi:hypothetical protein